MSCFLQDKDDDDLLKDDGKMMSNSLENSNSSSPKDFCIDSLRSSGHDNHQGKKAADNDAACALMELESGKQSYRSLLEKSCPRTSPKNSVKGRGKLDHSAWKRDRECHDNSLEPAEKRMRDVSYSNAACYDSLSCSFFPDALAIDRPFNSVGLHGKHGMSGVENVLFLQNCCDSPKPKSSSICANANRQNLNFFEGHTILGGTLFDEALEHIEESDRMGRSGIFNLQQI